MMAYMHLILLAWASVPTHLALAAPTPADIQTDWTDSAFVTCMKKTYPSFPSGVTDPQAVIGCKASHKKRDTFDASTSDMVPRDLPGLALSPHADCDDGSDGALPKNFVVVTDIRSQAATYCNKMKSDLIQKGVGQIDDLTNNAVTKSANELHGGKGAVISLLFALTPQGRSAMKAATVTDVALTDICTKAVTAIATKGDQGCTKDINWYNAGKAKSMTSTGARGGGLDVAFGADDFAYLAAEFLAPS